MLVPTAFADLLRCDISFPANCEAAPHGDDGDVSLPKEFSAHSVESSQADKPSCSFFSFAATAVSPGKVDAHRQSMFQNAEACAVCSAWFGTQCLGTVFELTSAQVEQLRLGKRWMRPRHHCRMPHGRHCLCFCSIVSPADAKVQSKRLCGLLAQHDRYKRHTVDGTCNCGRCADGVVEGDAGLQRVCNPCVTAMQEAADLKAGFFLGSFRRDGNACAPRSECSRCPMPWTASRGRATATTATTPKPRSPCNRASWHARCDHSAYRRMPGTLTKATRHQSQS